MSISKYTMTKGPGSISAKSPSDLASFSMHQKRLLTNWFHEVLHITSCKLVSTETSSDHNNISRCDRQEGRKEEGSRMPEEIHEEFQLMFKMMLITYL